MTTDFALIYGVEKSFNATTQTTVCQYYQQYNLQTPTSPYVSDTNELYWDSAKGIYTINTPRTQAAVGFTLNQPITLSNLELNAKTNFSAIGLVSLDNNDIINSKDLLLVASARAENSGMKWNGTKTSLITYGKPPVYVSEVKADIKINGLSNADLVVYSLDGRGLRKDIVPSAYQGNTLTFSIDDSYQTLWYEISNKPYPTVKI